MKAEHGVPRLDLAPKLKHPLQLWNPLDYVRLLCWVFFFPQALRWYVDTFADSKCREATGRSILPLLRLHPIQRNLAFQSALVSLLLSMIPPILVTVVHPNRIPSHLVFALVAGMTACALIVLDLLMADDLVRTIRRDVRISGLIGLILCVEAALLPYQVSIPAYG